MEILGLVDLNGVGPAVAGTQQREESSHIDPGHAFWDGVWRKGQGGLVGMPRLCRQRPTLTRVIVPQAENRLIAVMNRRDDQRSRWHHGSPT